MTRTKSLVTGGAGFYGGILLKHLLDLGHSCVSVDLVTGDFRHPLLRSVEGDIRNPESMDRLFADEGFDVVFHCAAMLAHDRKSRDLLWSSNVEGTQVIADMANRHRVGHVVFTSSNCLWARNFGRPVREDDVPEPIEIYGRSKWEGEQILAEPENRFSSTLIRCPTIIDEGRLGLLSILFEFIDDGRKVWVVGGGHNAYQFIYAKDLARACVSAAERRTQGVLNIGADDVKPFRDVYQYVIDRAGTGSRVATLPLRPALAAMRLAHRMRISPLGPYQYRMIAEDFVFDTTRIKRCLDWEPSLTNEEMLWKSYQYYRDNRTEIMSRKSVSAHRQAARMGVIRLLKWIS
ncbi:MAG: NAD-dependent epimerase/dehydratase family protein [Burkholderiaceae bacterium]|nr:NAD-dependent epimerase/dehydratase family protein [Burkholderiaceae bacterium]